MKLIYFIIPIVVSAFTPLIIIPGFGGSVLKKKNSKELLWPPSSNKWLGNSWIDSMKIEYKENKLSPIVPTELYPIGDINGIKITTPATKLLFGSEYYYNIVKAFQKDRQIDAISYDFRIITDLIYQKELFNNMTNFIEKNPSLWNEDIGV